MKNEIYHQFHPIGSSDISRCKINQIPIRCANSPAHELTKALIGYLIAKYGEVKINKRITTYINAIELVIDEIYADTKRRPGQFISEAQRLKNALEKYKGEARNVVDVVDINTGEEYEVETDEKRAELLIEEGKSNVIKLWDGWEDV